MSANAYEVLATAMRYVFVALILLIVLRGLRGALTDSRRADRLRRLSPETGIIGELLVIEGSERAKTGMRYPLTLEGTIGSSAKADIRVRSSGVRGRHAFYQMTERGLFVRGHSGARIARNGEPRTSEIMLSDGDMLRVGPVRLMLVLTEADATPEEIDRRVRRRDAAYRGTPRVGTDAAPDDLFDPKPNADDLFMRNPLGNFEINNEEDDRK